ncbi:MAG: methyltransferase domain-containing protein [Burkholderiales bacterium]|nr:methyltransferase domain-containing protein [Burkholderiales bacterium]
MDEVHVAAQQGFTKEAQMYARGRPEYPPALASWLTGPVALAPGRSVADIGAGTGKFTSLLPATGADVVALEPVDAMRAQLQQHLPAVRALAGTAQSMPLAGGSLDAVVCAQSFHWFANQAALDEFHRVLRPGGKLGLVWNVRDESVDWVASLTAIVTPYEGNAPRFYTGDWRQPFPHPGFTELVEHRFEHRHVGAPQQVIVDRFLSVSFIAALAPAECALVRERIEALIATHPALRGRATVSCPYQTLAFHCTRI